MKTIKTKEGIMLKAITILKSAPVNNKHGKCITYVMKVEENLILYTEVIKNNKIIDTEISPISHKCDIIKTNLVKHRIKYSINDLVPFDWDAFNDENDIK